MIQGTANKSPEPHAVYAGPITKPLDPGREVMARGYKFMVPEMTLGEREMLEDEGCLDAPYESVRSVKLLQAAREQNREKEVVELTKRVREQNREANKAITKVVATVLARNYPEIDEDFVKKTFSQTELIDAYAAAVGSKPEELAKAAAGETKPVAPAGSNGARSTAT